MSSQQAGAPSPYGGAVSLSPGSAGPVNIAPAPAAQAQAVALLAPMTGANAARGEALADAAKLALADQGSPRLDLRDTGGTPDGAAAAARAAIAAGDTLIIGPLTAAETNAAARVAQPAGVPMLAFTNDPSVARPGVWTLGITPDQQVRRLIGAVLATQHNRFAALLPRDAFGNAMGGALTESLASVGAPAADIQTYDGSLSGITPAVRQLASDAGRSGATTVASPAANQPGAVQPPAPANFDAIMLADVGGRLASITSQLSNYDLLPPNVRILGPVLWSSPSARQGAQLDGAWYAAPEPGPRSGFDARYTQAYGSSAPGLADFAYDAASLARALAQSGGYSLALLTRPDGFAGVDGVFALLPNGRVRRALALFEIHGDTAQVIQPAPTSLNVPGI